MNFKDLVGMTLKSVERHGDDQITFTTDNGSVFRMEHMQDCCEHVSIESVTGELNDLIDTPILMAEESSSEDPPEGHVVGEYTPESQTWTFYKLATIKGYVDIRWYGSSNGYYSESVDFFEVG